jgi:putative metalloprotease
VNSQFSQRQESEADDYSYDLLRKRGINPAGLATSFEKLAKLEAGRQSSCLMTTRHRKPRSAYPRSHEGDGIK